MTEFTIRIAGHTAGVRAIFDSTRHYCARYLTEEPAEIAIAVTEADLEAEQAELLAEALREHIRPRVFPDPFLERSVIQRKLARELLNRDILLLHGSALAMDGRGYLFTADCGTGKSTHTRLWRQVFGDRVVMVNDDKPFVKITGGGIFLCGAPWSGKHGLDANITVPLKGICILERGREDRIEPLSPDAALEALLRQTGFPEEPKSLELTRILTRNTALWRMACTRDPGAARVAHGAMSCL